MVEGVQSLWEFRVDCFSRCIDTRQDPRTRQSVCRQAPTSVRLSLCASLSLSVLLVSPCVSPVHSPVLPNVGIIVDVYGTYFLASSARCHQGLSRLIKSPLFHLPRTTSLPRVLEAWPTNSSSVQRTRSSVAAEKPARQLCISFNQRHNLPTIPYSYTNKIFTGVCTYKSICHRQILAP